MRTWYQFSTEISSRNTKDNIFFKNKGVTGLKCVEKGKLEEVNLLVTSVKEDLL